MIDIRGFNYENSTQMFIIVSFCLALLSLVLSAASIWNSNRLRLQFSRNHLKRDILEVKDEVEHAVKCLEREWEDTYDKLRSIMGRLDRAKRRGQPQENPQEMNGGGSPEEQRIQILNRAKQMGL